MTPPIEAVILALIAVMAGCFGIEVLWAKPSAGEMFTGLLPTLNRDSLYVAITIAFNYGGGSQFAPSLSITKAISDMIKSVLGTAPVFVTLDPKNAIPIPYSTLSNGG